MAQVPKIAVITLPVARCTCPAHSKATSTPPLGLLATYLTLHLPLEADVVPTCTHGGWGGSAWARSSIFLIPGVVDKLISEHKQPLVPLNGAYNLLVGVLCICLAHPKHSQEHPSVPRFRPHRKLDTELSKARPVKQVYCIEVLPVDGMHLRLGGCVPGSLDRSIPESSPLPDNGLTRRGHPTGTN